MKLFLDTNIILDLLVPREPFVNEISKIITLAENGKCQLFVSSTTMINCNYVLEKISEKKKIMEVFKKFRIICSILKVDEMEIDKAIFSNFSDFEDAVQYFCALHNTCDFIITRDKKGFKNIDIPTFTPVEFIHSVQL